MEMWAKPDRLGVPDLMSWNRPCKGRHHEHPADQVRLGGVHLREALTLAKPELLTSYRLCSKGHGC
jgi:hypothetical protein